MKKLIVGALSCGLLLLAGCRNNLVEPKHKSSADDYAIIQSSSHKKSHKKVEQPKKKSEDKKKKDKDKDKSKDENKKMDVQIDTLNKNENNSSSEAQSSSSALPSLNNSKRENSTETNRSLKSNFGTSLYTLPRQNYSYYTPKSNYYYSKIIGQLIITPVQAIKIQL